MAEQDYSELIAVREITDVHANWSEEGSDVPGKLSRQLILDDGAAEHVVRPDAKASKVLLELIGAGEDLVFDASRGVVKVSRVRS